MEETQVIIVGGGPSGLSLGLALGQYGVKSVILEQEAGIATDPRGVWLTGDAVRIMYGLGLGSYMDSIGQEAQYANFHQTSFTNAPWFQIPFATADSLQHALPEGFQMSQPKLEHAMRQRLSETSLCSLYAGCKVTGRSSEVPPTVEFMDPQGVQKQIRGQFLVGADGKTGIVRKEFLEATAGIRQMAGRYPYEGVWVASNLKLTVPTPATHPEFHLWGLGYSPEEVYDLYWPVGWHFCAPPGKPTAAGRFGPPGDRTWRHEFRVYNEDSAPIYSEELFWEHLMPNITLDRDDGRGVGFGRPVEYPRDCIEILRCRPFKFVHKCVTRWFHKRTMLIGDAAHVFPPFAGQGVASGARDAYQLAWRLAVLLRHEDDIDERLHILETWALERRQSVDDAALMSKMSGFACNNQPVWWVFLLAKLVTALAANLPSLWCRFDRMRIVEQRGFSRVSGGFHLQSFKGGVRLAQTYIKASDGGEVLLSDALLKRHGSIFTLLIINDQDEEAGTRLRSEAEAAIAEVSLAPQIISADSMAIYMANQTSALTKTSTDTFVSLPATEIKRPNKDEQRATSLISRPMKDVRNTASLIDRPKKDVSSSMSFVTRLGRSTRFAILRPDWFVFACARNRRELRISLAELKTALAE